MESCRIPYSSNIYIGIVVFRDILKKEEYYHFLILCCAVRICASESYTKQLPIAEKMFKSYIKMYIKLYGAHSISSNVHLLSHIVVDMQNTNVKNIMELSTYKYENCLRHIGLKIKHGYLPLEQVARRILESMQLHATKEENIFELTQFEPQLLYPSEPGSTMYNKIQISSDLMLSNKRFGDSWFFTKNDEIVKIAYATKESGKNQIAGMVITNKNAFFDNPIDSTKLKIYISDGKTSCDLRFFELNCVTAKMFCLPYREQFVFMPLEHSIDSLNFK